MQRWTTKSSQFSTIVKWGMVEDQKNQNTQTKLWKRFELYFTCKRSSDLAEPEGPATSTTSLACSATCCKGATKGVVHLELGNTLCSMEATDSWPRTHSRTSIIIFPLLLFLFFFTPTIQTTQRAIRKKQGRTPDTHTNTHAILWNACFLTTTQWRFRV